MQDNSLPALELRVALTAADFERILKVYTTGLGLSPAADFSGEQGRGMMVELGKASLEIFDESQAEHVDRIETGRRVSGKIRLAFRVPDVEAAVRRLEASGARLVHPPVVTPWGDRNARMEDPEGMQITLFE